MIRLGTDIVHIPRIQSLIERFGDRFLQRVYTPIEQEKCYDKGKILQSVKQLAGRWAAKEAVVKALGTGWQGISYTDVEIGRRSNGEPFVILHNKAAAIVAAWEKQKWEDKEVSVASSNFEVNYSTWQLSLSHDGNYAIATAILIC